MPARVIKLEEIPYSVFINRERDGYRSFWFCPHPDCFGAYRSDQLCETREDALRIGEEAAHEHEFQAHHNDEALLSLESNYEVRSGISIQG